MANVSKLLDRLDGLLPETLSQELREQVEAMISAHLAEMNVVTREQFDVQKRVLEKTRQKLTELEQRLAELE